MKKTILILAITAMLITGTSLMATTSRGLGLHFGTVSANGFSYRQFTGKNGFQATLGAISLGNNDDYFYTPQYGNYGGASMITLTEEGRRTNVNLGLNYLHTLADNPSGRFYVLGGASYLLSRIKQFEQDYGFQSNNGYEDIYVLLTNHPVRNKWETKNNYYIGAGIGFELNLGRNFHWAIELPITLNQDGDIMMYIPQTGLYYYFD
ncbi:MAG: hypothetical protein CVU50_00870 [Candidatus Cloacimonetes bacterium HGW-Cloacimonetes-3]|nr:MAG: hypothetical protein CVU50_00870 [Candidatus Cloacimonetes bacterium HGW-Cloacimonetes-3]